MKDYKKIYEEWLSNPYFDQDTKDALVRRFYNATVPGGHLFIGHSEGLTKATCPYQYIQPAIYRKASK